MERKRYDREGAIYISEYRSHLEARCSPFICHIDPFMQRQKLMMVTFGMSHEMLLIFFDNQTRGKVDYMLTHADDCSGLRQISFDADKTVMKLKSSLRGVALDPSSLPHIVRPLYAEHRGHGAVKATPGMFLAVSTAT